MIDSVRQRVSALYGWRRSCLRDIFVGRYRIHICEFERPNACSFAVQKV